MKIVAPDYDYWLRLGEWNAVQAAFIFNHVDPIELGMRVEFPADISENNQRNKQEWQRQVYRTYSIIKSTPKNEWYKYVGEASYSLYKFDLKKASPSAFISLAIAKQFKIPPELLEKWVKINKSTEMIDGKEEVTKSNVHTTPKLQLLLEAKDKFWTLYDRDDPSTAPTIKQVVDWLVTQKYGNGKNISKRAAEVMASTLRDESLPSGPRK